MANQVVERVTGERRLMMSYEEFLAFVDEDTHAEWVDGEVTVFMSASGIHQDLVGLSTTFCSVLGNSDAGTVRDGAVRCSCKCSVGRGNQMCSSCAGNQRRLTPMRLLGPADLVIEVVSDDSVTRDTSEKRRTIEAEGFQSTGGSIRDPVTNVAPPSIGWSSAGSIRRRRSMTRPVPLVVDCRGFWLDPEWFGRIRCRDRVDCPVLERDSAPIQSSGGSAREAPAVCQAYFRIISSVAES